MSTTAIKYLINCGETTEWTNVWIRFFDKRLKWRCWGTRSLRIVKPTLFFKCVRWKTGKRYIRLITITKRIRIVARCYILCVIHIIKWGLKWCCRKIYKNSVFRKFLKLISFKTKKEYYYYTTNFYRISANLANT